MRAVAWISESNWGRLPGNQTLLPFVTFRGQNRSSSIFVHFSRYRGIFYPRLFYPLSENIYKPRRGSVPKPQISLHAPPPCVRAHHSPDLCRLLSFIRREHLATCLLKPSFLELEFFHLVMFRAFSARPYSTVTSAAGTSPPGRTWRRCFIARPRGRPSTCAPTQVLR